VEVVATIIAWIVAFFPILSNATLGLRSADANLVDLFALYGASRWQRLVKLQLPAALPYILSGAKVSGGLALIGAIVAEFVAGSGTATGLAWVITEAGRNLQIAKMFAALGLLSAVGVINFYALAALEWAVLHRWHESAVKRQI
jgi:NitT/TauT family transport system permease protein